MIMYGTIDAAKQKTAMDRKLEQLFNSAENRNSTNLQAIEQDSRLVADYLPSNNQLVFNANGELTTNFGQGEFTLSNHALGQIGDKTGAPPAKYLRTLQETPWGRELSANILNEHAHNQPEKQLLVRVVGGRVRGVLSDKYRRYDASALYDTFIKGVRKLGARFYEANWSETKVELRALYNKIFEIKTPNNGTIFMAFGIRLKDSSFGSASLDVSTFNYQMICANGIVADRMLRQVHLGKGVGENGIFSDETYAMYSKANISAVTDMLGNTLSVSAIKSQIEIIQGLSAETIDLTAEVKRLPQMGLTMGETELVQARLLESNPEHGIQGAPTKWKLINAINSVGNDEGVANERRLELEELAGQYAGFKRVIDKPEE